MLIPNLFLRMGVIIVGFTSELLATHLGHPGGRTAVVVYGYLAIAIFLNLLWRYAACRNGHLAATADRSMADKITEQYNYGPLALAGVSISCKPGA